MVSKLVSSTLNGIDAMTVEVEVDHTGAVGNAAIVGLPDLAVRESLDRVRSALINSNFYFPSGRVVINLAPADLRKEGVVLDLPIALGLMAASDQLGVGNLRDFVVLGELALDGSVRPVRGVLSMTIRARDEGRKGILVPRDNAIEAGVVSGIEVYAVSTLREAAGFLTGDLALPPVKARAADLIRGEARHAFDFDEVRGNETAKRALTVAAAGGHNLIMIGPPGSGKTMLAQRVPTILPPMTEEECLQTTRVHSIAGELGGQPLVAARPFRAPHHTASTVAMVGGGNVPRPGEISMAHNGVLFLDELPEFPRATLEVLRQPLENGDIVIDRAGFSAKFPARFMLIAAMNPCPCGFRTDPRKACSCTPQAVERYLSRISGPLLDRIDIHMDVPVAKPKELQAKRSGDTSAVIAERVAAARARQHARFAGTTTMCNAAMTARDLEEHCKLDSACQALLHNAMEALNLSNRAYTRILKVARTIADLAAADRINESHLSEAVQYRNLDRHQ